MSKFSSWKPTLEKNDNNYEALYREEAKKFWDLQQIQQTEEEKEYEELCHQLEEMSMKFREEIDTVAGENHILQEKITKNSNNKKLLEDLSAEEQTLIRIIRNYT
ncbi:hypothetical protein TVAG_112960 [Trichomonas vaginalis G3]|uniref:Uncharacterized protein n=1 Tax=Trichomonas vaginalis (strain ATCC PRA-98 / G3) TaxID=412133 RepID=A2F743_TRIV3|nr:hypothetical protein TVAGG3_0258670 [Trichomonas vaginalis G3]EAX99280.1 hypothetical protein TVAG_112960 [Trichomonas vaginalis G3]KAI5524946.1 hypothetical protein TVAGG3_0258670 [Trichomonas vaginalis G3]|eukprot:XP_001312210.1 hypothetical protein [Trichomonas vaginalis G3]